MTTHFQAAARVLGVRATIPRIAFVFGYVLLASCGRASVADTLGDIQAAWKKRSEAVRSAEFHLKARVTYHRGRWTGPDDIGPQPPADVSYDRTVAVTFDGSKLRYESDGFIWRSGVLGELVRRRNITTFDGNTHIDYYPLNESGGSDAHIGGTSGGSHLDIVPIARAFPRFAAERTRFTTIEGASVDEKRVDVDGHECLVVKMPLTGEHWEAVLHVDPACDFAVRRYLDGYRHSSGQFEQNLRAEIQYRRDAQTGIWVPSAWKSSWRPERAGDSFFVEVIKYSLNPVVLSDRFTVTRFAPGTFVYDMRKAPPNQTFYVKSNGRLRPIPEKDLQLSREELERTEPNYGKPPRNDLP